MEHMVGDSIMLKGYTLAQGAITATKHHVMLDSKFWLFQIRVTLWN